MALDTGIDNTPNKKAAPQHEALRAGDLHSQHPGVQRGDNKIGQPEGEHHGQTDHLHEARTAAWKVGESTKPWTRNGQHEPKEGSLDFGKHDPYRHDLNEANNLRSEHEAANRHGDHKHINDWHKKNEHLHEDNHGNLIERQDRKNEVKAFKKDGTEVDVKQSGDHVDRTIRDEHRSLHTDGQKVDYHDDKGNKVLANQETGEVKATLDGTHVTQRRGDFDDKDRTKDLARKDEGVESAHNGVAYTHHDGQGGSVYKDSTMDKDGEAARYQTKDASGSPVSYTAKTGANGLELHRTGPDGKDQVVDTDKEQQALRAQGIQVQKTPDGQINSMTLGSDGRVSVAKDGTMTDRAKQMEFKPGNKEVSLKGASGKTVKVQGGPVQTAGQVNDNGQPVGPQITNDSDSPTPQLSITDGDSPPAQIQMQPDGDAWMDGVVASPSSTSFDGTSIGNDLSVDFSGSGGGSWGSDGTVTSDAGSTDDSQYASGDDGDGGKDSGAPLPADEKELLSSVRGAMEEAKADVASVGPAPPPDAGPAAFQDWWGRASAALGLVGSVNTEGFSGQSSEQQALEGAVGAKLAGNAPREENVMKNGRVAEVPDDRVPETAAA
jgi:hypothetical protein